MKIPKLKLRRNGIEKENIKCFTRNFYVCTLYVYVYGMWW